MNRYSGFMPLKVFLLLLVPLLLLAACSDDDPTAPVPLPDPLPMAVSPDSLMSMWQTALTTMDSTSYAAMYAPGFEYRFGIGDMNYFDLTTDHMTGSEIVQTGWNMFSKETFTNWMGDGAPAVARITFPQMTQETPWQFVTVGSEPPVASARFTMQMFVERGPGIITLLAAGSYDFFAVPTDTVDAGGNPVPYYRWLAMTAVDPGKTRNLFHSWGGVNLTYMTDEAPEPVLTVSDLGGSPLPVFRCDATGSRDLDSGLHEAPYRWRFGLEGAHISIVDWTEWTEWAADPIIIYPSPGAGQLTVQLEVQDRWGVTSVATETVQPQYAVLPFPSSPDQLMVNFQTAYETRNFGAYQEMLHPDFMTILQQQTTEEFPDVGATLDVDEEQRIHIRMFSGEAVTDPEGFLVPGVQGIYFSVFQPLDTWTVSPPDDLIPNSEWAPYEVDVMFDRGQGFSTLKVQGVIRFFVTGRDTLHEGTLKKYYQMNGQVDLTGFKSVETGIWGSIKALWR